MPLELMFITNDPRVAKIAETSGVNRIWIDLETLGKEERQKNMNTVKSHHSVEDIARVKAVLSNAELLVRVNPWNGGSAEEIEQVISAGADRIMLPMWETAEQANMFLKAVGGRVKTTLLLETDRAARCVDEVLNNPLLDEIHIGLNDLHLSRGLTFMFELLSDGTVEALCAKFKKAGIKYGFGGIARIGEGTLPAEKIVTEHYRLGSTRAILSRSFCNVEEISSLQEIERIFTENMKTLREFEKKAEAFSAEEFEQNVAEVKLGVEKIVKVIKEKKANG